VVISTSIGIALSTQACFAAEDLVRDAELAMYRAKRAGRAGCEVFDPGMHTSAVRRLKLETDLRKALETKEFKVYYQPIVSLESGKIVGFEALSRWQRPEGLVLPGEFISVADETGIILPINRSLMLEACRQLATWQSEFPSEQPLTMSMNISPKQFAQSDLAREIRGIIEQTGVAPRSVQLEIMETIAMGDAERSADVLAELKSIGVCLSIDDFGTGYSSLSRIQRLPVDSLKVDRTFISTMGDNSDSQEIVKLVIAMAHTLNLRVVAEGTEKEEQISILKRLKCEMAQGYFFSRPGPADTIGDLLRNPHESRAAFAQSC
jgi:EAL domain-containing protein (putative c-di-GMP-specific phosphodiesterase class I)